MSWEVTALVSRRILGGQSRKLLMLIMADKANDDGSGVYMSFQTLAEASEMNRSTVKRIMGEFEAEGLVVKVGTQPCPNGWTNDYTIDVARLRALPEIVTKTGGVKDRVRSAPGVSRDTVQQTPGAIDLHPVRGAPQDPGRHAPLTRLDDDADAVERVRDPAAHVIAAVNHPLLDPAKSHRLLLSGGEVSRWIREGATLEAITLVVTAVMAKRKPGAGPVQSWAYFAPAVRQHVAECLAPDQPIQPAIRTVESNHVQPAESPKHYGITASNISMRERSNRAALAALRSFGAVGDDGGCDPAEGAEPRFVGRSVVGGA